MAGALATNGEGAKEKPAAKEPAASQPRAVQGRIVDRLGKDEMSLVEHPFASLQKEKDTRIIELRWETKHPVSGKTLEASWRVAGDPQLGLPTANDERLYLVMMEITREMGWPQTVQFSRPDLLKRLGWPPSNESYRMLHEAFARLKGVSITAQNAFYNSKNNWLYSGYFGILDEAFIANEGPGRKAKGAAPQSFFRWNSTLHQSFVQGNIRTLDLDFALSLKRPISLRLFRYLDKKSFNGQKSFQVGLRELCEMHLGMAVDGRYESQLRASLDPAHTELKEQGFLVSATLEPMKTRKGSKVVYNFARRPALSTDELPTDADTQSSLALAPNAERSDETSPIQLQLILPLDSEAISEAAPTAPDLEPSCEPLSAVAPKARRKTEPQKPVAASETAVESRSEVFRVLVRAGVSEGVAEELCASFAEDAIQLQLDCLGDREPKNPAATLVSAIRQAWAPPPSFLERLESERRAAQAREQAEVDRSEKAAQTQARRQNAAEAEAEADRLDALWDGLDEAARDRLETQARHRLGVLGDAGRAPAALSAMRRTLLKALEQEAA